MSDLRYIPGVTSLRLDRDQCLGCGVCLEVCPHGVFAMEAGKAVDTNRDACIECGACALNCSAGAIGVSPGVGCARAIINGWLHGTKSCDCGGSSDCC